MKPSSSNAGINKLARVMQQRMKEVGASPLLLDFGVIQDDYSLLTNSYPIPIPKADYMVCRQLTHGEAGSLLTVSATDGLKPGDRVLVAWVQNDAVVIDIVLPATKIGG